MNIVGMRGFKKTGYGAGLVGTIEKCDMKEFSHLFTVRMEDGSGFVTSENDIEIIHEIVLTDWEYHCTDGCCDEYGTELLIDNYIVTRYFDMDTDLLIEILNKLGIRYELKFETEGDY